MKITKYIPLLLSILLFTACSGNKNILQDKMSKYPYQEYITKIVSAEEKQEAKDLALIDIKKLFDDLPNTDGSKERRALILSQAEVVEWWKAPDGEDRYYALAVLKREPALQIMEPYYASIDPQLQNLTTKINTEQDKFLRLKYAISMPELITKRDDLDNEYKKISYEATPYQEAIIYNARSAYNKTFYDIKINSTITGDENEFIKTPIISSLNTLGFQVGENLQSADIALEMKVALDKYESESLKGLFWCTSTATVRLKDLATGGIFATFSNTERIGSARKEEAERRSLVSAGQKCSPQVKEKILNYIKKK